jgi:hypothetical protein
MGEWRTTLVMIALMVVIAAGFVMCGRKPVHREQSGNSCLGRLEYMKKHGERYSGEFEDLQRNCAPEPSYGRY